MRRAFPLISFLAFLAAACGGAEDEGGVALATIDSSPLAFDDGMRLSYAGQQLRGATAQGLVTLDQTGEVVPAAAESWIVTDEGRSYIFRLRQARWPDGDDLTAREVRASLRATMRDLAGTSLGLDLRRVRDVRVMTGRVIEIRLSSPMPEFLHLLAQPELGIRRPPSAAGLGPMRLTRDGAVARLAPLDPDSPDPDRIDPRRALSLRTLPAGTAVDRFRDGQLAAIFDGRLPNWPFADVGPLSRGTVRLDPALGLFGLEFLNADGLLADPARREALSMAIDREALFGPFNIGGVSYETRVVPDAVESPAGVDGQRWPDLGMEQRRAEARRRIAGWSAGAASQQSGEETGKQRGEKARQPTLRLRLPPGEGSDMLFAGLASDFAAIGVRLERAGKGGPADLALTDRLARYAAPRWFLNQFNCSLSVAICSQDADLLVEQAVAEPDGARSANLIAEAEGALAATEPFIPLAMPIRWSMVRGSLGGFAENRWGWHPLFPIASAPTS